MNDGSPQRRPFFVPMTRAELIIDLENLIGPGIEVDDGGLSTWLNDAYMYVVDEITKVNPDYFTTVATADTEADQQEYDLPDDFEKALMVNIEIDDTWRRCRPLATIGDVPIHARTDSAQGFDWGDPYYYLYGGVIGFMPIPDEDGDETIKL